MTSPVPWLAPCLEGRYSGCFWVRVLAPSSLLSALASRAVLRDVIAAPATLGLVVPHAPPQKVEVSAVRRGSSVARRVAIKAVDAVRAARLLIRAVVGVQVQEFVPRPLGLLARVILAALLFRCSEYGGVRYHSIQRVNSSVSDY